MIYQCQYHCPKCNKSLSKGTKVQLLFKKPGQEELKQILLEPEPGNYDFYTNPPTNFNQGERVEFHCPKCKTDLDANKDKEELYCHHCKSTYPIIVSNSNISEITYN